MKRLSILGSTGSIGTQALCVCEAHGFPVVGLAAYQNEKLLEEQTRRFRPQLVCIFDESHFESFRTRVADLPVQVVTGIDGLCQVAALSDADMVLNAVSGMIGLRPTLAAIEEGKEIALANKETLVTGGELVMSRAREKKIPILPVDSEHSAIFQCLNGYRHCKVNKILLTASGGPFFGKTGEELQRVTKADALRHPNWSMGAKITIDSATMMNKGLELIEACWLFDVQPKQVEVVVHRESVIHSAVEFEDYSVIAQLGVPDMKIPIQYAVTYPDRSPCPTRRLNLFEMGKLTFFPPDEDTFSCLRIAREAFSKGHLYPTLMNCANELAVQLFLEDRISFQQIPQLVEGALTLDGSGDVTVENILAAEQAARAFVRSSI